MQLQPLHLLFLLPEKSPHPYSCLTSYQGMNFPSWAQPRAPLLPYTYPVLSHSCWCCPIIIVTARSRHIAYWVQHFPQHHLSGSGIAQLEFYHCREPAWGAPPMTKVMRKEARHTQRRDRASGVPLEILEHLPPKTRVCLLSALCFHPHLWLYGGLSPTTSLWKKS